MYWLRRPPFLRWLIAASLVVTGLAFEMDCGETERYPFAAAAIEAGSSIGEAIEWRDVPVGLLPAWLEPPGGIAGYDIGAGDPLVPNLRSSYTTPAGWWSIPMPLPVATVPGTPLRLLDSLTGEQMDGVVDKAGLDDGFETTAMVAFPPEAAPRAAQAVASDAFVVMIGHGAGAPVPNG